MSLYIVNCNLLGSASRYHLFRSPTGAEFRQRFRVLIDPHETLDNLRRLEDFPALGHPIMKDFGLLLAKGLELG